MHILVTGHLGYVGPGVVAALKAVGHRVTGADIGYFRECIDPEQKTIAADRELCVDVRDIAIRNLNGIDAIVHLAGLSNDPLGELNPELTADINHRASIALARMGQQAGVGRFVFASSCSIYGAAGPAALDETARFKPEFRLMPPPKWPASGIWRRWRSPALRRFSFASQQRSV